MSELYGIDRAPAEAPDQRPIYVGDLPIAAARGCIRCVVFSESEIMKAIFGSTGLQKDLFSDTETGRTSSDPIIEQLTRDEVTKRAEAGINGTCPFIVSVKACWRRLENRATTPMDDLLER